MENEIKTWLEDINQAIEEIYSFLPGKRDFIEYTKDLKGKRATERNLEIIGEAVNRILKVKPDFPIENARRIVDTRNRISHGHDTVSDDIIWYIIVRDLDNLKKQVTELLSD